jgi:hypothetical protein
MSLSEVSSLLLALAFAFASRAGTAAAAASTPAPSGAQRAPSSESFPATLGLGKTRLQLNPDTTVAIPFWGGEPPYSITVSVPVVDARLDAASGTLVLQTRALGSATLTVSDAAGATVTASVLVGPNAGFVPADVDIALLGNPSGDFVATQIRAALVRACHPFPGVLLAVAPAVAPELHPGERLDLPVRVRLDGRNRYVDVQGVARVHVEVGAAPPIVPATLFYSDDPEKLRSDGVLFRGTLTAGRPVRLYYYHQAVTAGHEVAILLDSPAGTASVRVVGEGAGPNPAVMFVGQSATFRYLDDRARGAGVELDVPVGAPVELFTSERPMDAGDLVAGALDIADVDGDPVRVTVVSRSDDSTTSALLANPELPTDGKYRRGEYDLTAVRLFSLAYTTGETEPAPISVGGSASALPNLRTGGRALAGDYGLVRPVDVRISNRAALPASVFLYEQAVGFPVTTTIDLHGDPAPTRVRCVKNAADRYLVRAFAVPPNTDMRVTGAYMTDGGSTYPLAFGLTATAPLPPPASMTEPNGCFPKHQP